jgi:hypothetical protein
MCLLLLGAVAQTMAQAPASIAGKGFGMTITAGTFPLASSGFCAFAPASSGNTYQLIGFQNVADSSGTYSYSTAGATGQASLNDSAAGPIVCKFTFTNATSGFYLVTNTLYAVSQNGTFLMFTNPTPSSISGNSFDCVAQAGALPYASYGEAIFRPASSVNIYTISCILGCINSSGTYAYGSLNTSVARIQLNDSLLGAETAYAAFSSPSNGLFAVKQTSSGAFQTSMFTMTTPDTTPPTVTITSPTSNPTYSTTNVTIGLAGTATDNVRVTQVNWTNSRGGSGIASGISSWSVDNVSLQSGLNLLTVRAIDAAGNTGTNTLAVTNLTRIISLSGTLAFGGVVVGGSNSQTLTITNGGNSTLTVSGIVCPAGFSGTWSGTVASGVSQDVIVTFSPGSATSYGGSLSVNSDATSGSNTISLSGTGTLPVLAALRQGGNVVLSWPTNAAVYTLIYATNLPAVDWATSSPAPSVVNGQYSVTNATTSKAGFYRLKKNCTVSPHKRASTQGFAK